MKKKSLLILPVLLLALAACNKEEEVVEPEDNTPTVTEPTEPSDTSEDEKEDEKEDLPPVVIDERIKVAEGVATLEDSNVEPSTASYRNLSDLSITDVSEDEKSGDITYVLGGTANAMNDQQAGVYWNSVAAIGDAYFVLTLELKVGETATWQAPDKEKSKDYDSVERPEVGEEDLILRISGAQCYPASAEGSEKKITFTISDGTDSVKHIVDFSDVTIVDARVTLPAKSAYFDDSVVPFTNPDSLYIDSMTVDASGNVTYYLAGTPDVMNACQEEAFQVSGAAGSAYVVLIVTLESGETLTTSGGNTAEETEGFIIRVVNYGSTVFTITDGNSQTVTHTVVYSGLTHPSTGDDGGNGQA